MTVNVKPFLYENDPNKNLKILADFSFSDTSGTKCLTEKAYKKVPWTNHSNGSALREFSLLAAGFTAFAAPFYIYLTKSAECYGHQFNLDWTQAKKCWSDQSAAFGSQVATLTYFKFLSLTTVAGMAAYGGSRWYFQDRSQEARFQMLHREYTAAAQSLIDQYNGAKKDQNPAADSLKNRNQSKGGELGHIVETAKKLSQNCELIYSSLREVARLSDSQAKLLVGKISNASLAILDREEPAETSKIPRSFVWEKGLQDNL